MVGDDGPLQRREILGALVFGERRAQDMRLVAVRGRAGEQVDRARELALAQELARQRFDQPADGCERDGRAPGRLLGARLGAQHRDDVLDVEA